MKFILATLACLLWATALKAETLTLKGTVTDREKRLHYRQPGRIYAHH